MRITTKKGRDFAFKLRAIRNERTGKKKWFVGITTKEYFWLDLNTKLLATARVLAVHLRAKLRTQKVYIFKTTKSYWLVTKRKLFGEDWDREYEYWLRFSEDIICHPFCLCCIRYHKGTLRVSAKKGKRPKLVMVISRLDGESKPFTARVRDHLFSKTRCSHVSIYARDEYKHFDSLVGEYGAVYTGLNRIKSIWRTQISLHFKKMQELMNVYRSISPFGVSKSRVFDVRGCKGGLANSHS